MSDQSYQSLSKNNGSACNVNDDKILMIQFLFWVRFYDSQKQQQENLLFSMIYLRISTCVLLPK